MSKLLVLVSGVGITKPCFHPANGGLTEEDAVAAVVAAFSSFFFKNSAFLAAATPSEYLHSLKNKALN